MKAYRFSQKMLNCIWMLSLFLVIMLMAVGTRHMQQASQMRQEVQSRRMRCAELRRDLEETSDYLTEQARSYVMTGNLDDMDSYWEEIHTEKRREAVVGELGRLGLSEHGVRLLEAAKNNSDLLVYLETRAMRLAAESWQTTEEELPAEVRDYVLNVVEQSMSPEQKYMAAVSLLFGEQYTSEKEVIGQYTTQFMEAAEQELDKELEQAEKRASEAMTFQWVLQAAAVLLFVLVLAACYYMTIHPVLYYHRCLSQGEEEKLRPNGIREVSLLGLSIRSMYQNMHAALKAKDEFLASVSHEIRTPLYSVLGYQTLLEQTELTREQKEHLACMEHASAHLLEMVTHLLDYEKLENQKMAPVNGPWKPADLAEYLNAGFHHLARAGNLEFQVTIKDGVPPYLYGDAAMIRQIGANLASNAVKFTHAGRIDILLDWESEGDGNGGGILFLTVKDTGEGIRAEDMERIFAPFEQSDMAAGSQYAGTGLGLSICRRLAALMGGTVSGASTWGKGSVFTAEIPQGVAEEPKAPKAPPGTEVSGCVLLAEDNQVNQRMQEQLLGLLGVSVRLAANGREAVELAEKEAFDMIFMDLRMPDMDGYEAAAAIRRWESEHPPAGGRPGHTPIIALTADGDRVVKERVLKTGLDGLMVKPVNLEQLRAVISRYRNQAKPESGKPEPGKPEPGKSEFEAYLSRQLAGLFCREHLADIDRLNSLSQEGHYGEMPEVLHRLRGASAVVGADRIMELSHNLEQRLKAGDFTAIQVDQAVSELKTAFDGFCDGQEEVPEPGEDRGVFGESEMEAWKGMVLAGEFEALAVWKEHRAAFTDILGAEQARAVETALSAYRYQDVMNILESM